MIRPRARRMSSGVGIVPVRAWSRSQPRIVLDARQVSQIIALPGAKNASGVDFDPATGTVYVASQDSDNLLIVDLASGDVVHDVAVGAGALNVVFEPVAKLAMSGDSGNMPPRA